MKKRKSALVAFLLAAVTGIGIGYAAVADELRADGSIIITNNAVTNDFDKKIFFKEVTSDNVGGADYSASIVDTNVADTIEFTVKGLDLANRGKTIVIGATIQNDNAVAANITINATKSTSSFGTFANNVFTDAEGLYTVTLDLGAATVAAGGELDITFTVKLNDGVTPTDAITDIFTFSMNAESAT